jgi:SAM-dependent methyltransferase
MTLLMTMSSIVSQHQGGKRLYPAVWDHQWHHLVYLRRSLEKILHHHIMPTEGERVVDVGCGDRPYEPLFRNQGCEYIACDLQGNVDIRLEPGQPIALPDASVDGVVSFQVLEHVWDLDWYLGECHRILKPGGWLLLSTHGSWLYHPHPSDYRRWTRDGLVAELRDRGFEVKLVDAVVGPLAWTTEFRLLGMHHFLQSLPFIGPLLLIPVICLMNLRMVVEDAITPSSIRETNACVYVTVSRK